MFLRKKCTSTEMPKRHSSVFVAVSHETQDTVTSYFVLDINNSHETKFQLLFIAIVTSKKFYKLKEYENNFVYSFKECRGAFPVVKCTYCRSEFQQTV